MIMSTNRTRWRNHIPELVRWMAREGLTTEEMATELGVPRRTFRDWCEKHQALREALEEGRLIADARVEDSLYRRALGYEYEEVEVVESSGGRRERTIRKHIPPDVTACIFWLKNRRPQAWRDVSRIEATIDDRSKEAGRELAENAEARELLKQAFRVINGEGRP